MSSKNLLSRISLLTLALVLTGCAPAPTSPPPVIAQTPIFTSTILLTSTPAGGEGGGDLNYTPEPICPTPTAFNLTEIPPEWFFTPIPDPNFATISVQIEEDFSQKEITRILFAKWLDHFLGENISPEWRLIASTIDRITIPSPQYCAKNLGGLFIAEAEVTVETFLPPPVPVNRCKITTQWFIAGGGPVSATGTHMTNIFKAVIKKSGDTYTLEIIFNVPLCI